MPNVTVAFGLPTCYRIRGTALSEEEFIAILNASDPILGLEDLEQALRNGMKPSSGTVLTFDDGYREHIDFVARVLSDRGLTATFYVATGFKSRFVAAVDAWYWLLDNATQRTARVPMPHGNEYIGRIDSLTGKREWVSGSPKKALLEASASQQRVMLESLSESTGALLPDDFAERLYMQPSDWARLVNMGMRVGAHSVSHPILPLLSDEQLASEVRQSVEVVSKVNNPVAFSYPNGDYDARVVRELKRMNVSSAVTCVPGRVSLHSDVLLLPREVACTSLYLDEDRK